MERGRSDLRTSGAGHGTVTAALAVLAFAAFLAAPVRSMSDSRYALLVSEVLLRTGRVALDGFVPAGAQAARAGETIGTLEDVGGRTYYFFPNAGSVLSVPFVAVTRHVRGLALLDAEGRYDARAELRAQALLAALLMAAFTALAHRTARLALAEPLAAMVALMTAFGTQVLSTTSRVLWSDTWGIVLVMLVARALLRQELLAATPSPAWIGTLLAWAYFARPTNGVFVALVLVYLVARDRRLGLQTAAVAACWMAGFVATSQALYGQPLPSYFTPGRLGGGHVLQALAGNLMSPSRGLLVYVPVVLYVLYLVARYRRWLPARAVALLAVAACMVFFIPLSFFDHWWGGHSFGPRLTTGLLPWLVVLAALGLRARRDAATEGARVPRAEVAVAAALAAASVAINAAGAVSHETSRWNHRPYDVDQVPSRVWEWRRPQFLAAARGGTRPLYPLLAAGVPVELAPATAEPFLGRGWSWPEEFVRWADRPGAEIGFTLSSIEPAVLRLVLQPGPRWPDAGEPQLVDVALNDQRIARWSLEDRSPRSYAVGVGPPLLAHRNRLVMRVANADLSTPTSSGDGRDLYLGARFLTLAPYRSLAPGEAIRMASPEAESHLGAGWADAERGYRWTLGPSADLHFGWQAEHGMVMRIRAEPHVGRDGRGQALAVALNGAPVAEFMLPDPVPQVVPVVVPRDRLAEQNLLTFSLPFVPGGAAIERRIGIAVHEIEAAPFPPIPRGAIDWASDAAEPYLGRGWTKDERGSRWTLGAYSEIVFALPNAGRDLFAVEILAEPLLGPGVDRQRLEASLNGKRVGAFSLAGRGTHTVRIPVPEDTAASENVLGFQLPDATSPLRLGVSGDPRPVALHVFRVDWIER